MADNQPLPIANGFYLSDAPVISAQQCINWYPNIVQTQGLSQETLFGTAGLEQLQTTGVLNQQNRGSEKMGGIPFFVNGDTLYRLNRTSTNPDVFTTDALGTIEGTGRVSMATNGTQLVIMVPGGKGSVWNEGTTTFTADINAVDSDFTANGNPQYVVYVDGFFLYITDEKKFIISNLNNALAYNALDFGSAEASPDEIVGVVVYNNQVYILGAETIEGFENIGGSGFPFQRNGIIDDTGLFARFSIINGDDAFRFVGAGKDEGPGIYEFKGNKAVKISNTAIDTILQDLTDSEISNIFAMHYGQNGQFFTAFTVESSNQSFEYNAVSGRWHQRTSFISGASTAWRVGSIVSGYGRLLCGDRIDGRIGAINEDVFTEYGENIRRTLDTIPFAANGNSFSVSSLELTADPGIGDATNDPQMRMSRSLTAGKTFTDELSRGMGKIGEYERRAIWRRLGRAKRYEMFRFEMSEDVKPAIIMLQARFKGGTR